MLLAASTAGIGFGNAGVHIPVSIAWGFIPKGTIA